MSAVPFLGILVRCRKSSSEAPMRELRSWSREIFATRVKSFADYFPESSEDHRIVASFLTTVRSDAVNRTKYSPAARR